MERVLTRGTSGGKMGSSTPDRYGPYAFDIISLLSQIGNRDVVVDACLPPQLANDLRHNNLNAIWVPAILGDGATDGEIERQLLAGHWNKQWTSGGREKVLLTRDVEFYKRIRGRAILVSYRIFHPTSRRIPTNLEIRKELKRMVQKENFRR
jgi:hypothetical protein